VTEAEAPATLEESGAILKGADSNLATKEVGRRAFHELEAVPIGIVEGENDAGVVFASQVFFTPKPPRLGKDAAACADPVFHEFTTKGGRGNRVRVRVTNDWNPSQDNLAVTLCRGRATVGTEGSEKNVIILRNSVEGGFSLEFEDEILFKLLRRPAAR
jgi:hypothetical protein